MKVSPVVLRAIQRSGRCMNVFKCKVPALQRLAHRCIAARRRFGSVVRAIVPTISSQSMLNRSEPSSAALYIFLLLMSTK